MREGDSVRFFLNLTGGVAGIDPLAKFQHREE